MKTISLKRVDLLSGLKKMLKFVLISLVIACVYDPADKLLGLKVPLFSLAWLLFGLMALQKKMTVSKGLMGYVFLFLLIPLISITSYLIMGDYFSQFDGYIYFKSYLFLTLAIVLYATGIDLIKPTVVVLTSVALLTILMAIVASVDSSLLIAMNEFGQRYGIFDMGGRMYGEEIFPNFFGTYFHTSELMILPVGYFTAKTFFSRGASKMFYGVLLIITIFAMLISTTRNNILASLLVPLCIVFWYSKRKILVLSIVLALAVLCVINRDAIVNSMFDPNSPSNLWKISFLRDYLNLFVDDKVLLFGQGLGSYFRTTLRGYVSVTELTYFEFIRRFGLVLSIPTFLLFLYPLTRLKFKKYRSSHYLFIVYLFYLAMAFFNPFLMSSNGMLLLSIVLFKTFSGPGQSTGDQSGEDAEEMSVSPGRAP